MPNQMSLHATMHVAPPAAAKYAKKIYSIPSEHMGNYKSFGLFVPQHVLKRRVQKQKRSKLGTVNLFPDSWAMGKSHISFLWLRNSSIEGFVCTALRCKIAMITTQDSFVPNIYSQWRKWRAISSALVSTHCWIVVVRIIIKLFNGNSGRLWVSPQLLYCMKGFVVPYSDDDCVPRPLIAS